MHEHDLPRVCALYSLCHPGWPKKPPAWFMAVTSLVIRLDGKIVAWGALSLSPPPTVDLSQRLGPNAICAWLIDSCVHPDYQGQGLGSAILAERIRLAEEAGACMAIGACAESNSTMRAMLDKQGFKFVETAKNAFPDGSAGRIYIKTLGV
jgi:GNAT superfamily N-acetyltransferase